MKRLLPILLLSAVAFSCDPEKPEDPKDPFDTFDRRAMLQNMGENVIMPALDFTASSGIALDVAAQNFALSPSQITLDKLQTAWVTAAKAWAQVEMYRFGPMDEAGLNTVAAIHYGTAYPMNYGSAADKAGINAAVSGSNALDSAWISIQAGNKRGLPAIEYLIFSKEERDEKILSDFSAPRRFSYLQAATADLRRNLSGIANAWKPSGGNFINSFVNADGRDLGSSIGMVMNELAFMVEMHKNEKVGRPLGKRTAGNPQPNLVEARESMQSLALIKENIRGLKNLFEGRSGTVDGSGFDDLLNHLGAEFAGQPLAAMIEQQCDVVIEKTDAISSFPLDEAVTKIPPSVEILYNEAKKLLVLMKVDAANNIGVQITYFDNDGD
jgi:predicted lipoprotein